MSFSAAGPSRASGTRDSGVIGALGITRENQLFRYRPFESLRDQGFPVIEVLEITRENQLFRYRPFESLRDQGLR